jgi:threonine/homoserine/homoserine lactone efflux protein
MELFLSALVIGYSGAMMPGPLLTYCIERSMSRGWKVGLLIPLGHVLLEIIIVALLAFGLGRFLNAPLPKMLILFIGGVVLLWFGFDMLRGAIKGTVGIAVTTDMNVAKGANLEILMKSGMISALNPYFLLWWATIGLGFLLANSSLGVWGILVFYLGHATADFTWYFAVSLLCDKISKFIHGNAYRVVIGVLGTALGFFAVKFIVEGILLLKEI